MESEAQRQRPRIPQPSQELSSKELAEVIQEASRRQGQALEGEGAQSLNRVDDAFALAEELGIPEEHVRAALAAQQKKKLSMGAGSRLLSFVAAGAGGVFAAVGLKLLGLPALLAVLVAAAVAAGILTVALIAAMMKRYPAQATGAPPVPGTCRVCFRPAHTPQSTFCDEHRYKSPAEPG